jgi:ABC-type lipoprotein release transport system permease subunit
MKKQDMIWSIAWKNVWRNRKRSLIVITAVLLGTTAGVFTSGLMEGWVNQRIKSVIYTEVGHIKLHNPDFLNNEEIGNTIPQSENICAYLEKKPGVKAFSKRIKLMAMASTSRGNTALMLQGIDVDKEKKVSDLFTKIAPGAGNFFEGSGAYPISISDKTAEQLRIKSYKIPERYIDSLKNIGAPYQVIRKLTSIVAIRYNTENLFKKELGKLLNKKEVSKYGSDIVKVSEHYRLRSKIVFTFTDKNGELINQSFRVCGIFNTTNTMFDQMNAYVLKNDLAQLAGLGVEDCHEIGILLDEDTEVKAIQQDLRKEFPRISVMNWLEMAPDAGMISEYMDFFYLIIMGFILFALAFGIINTMLMAILERTKELGMLMAIGMNKKRVFNMIMLETIFLTLVGALAGMLIGWIIIEITGHTGLDFSSVGEGFEAMGWAAVIYPEITPSFFFTVTLLVIATGILSSIFPARKALSLNPVEAIRSDN